MSDEGVIGVDRPPRDGRTLRWWEIALIALLAVGAIAWIVDEFRTTDTEAVATDWVDYSQALADRDGDRACELLSQNGQVELAALAAALGEATPDCEAAVRGSSLVPDEQRGAVKDLDAERAEELVSVDGDHATITVPSGTVEILVSLTRSDGDWTVDSATESVRPSENEEGTEPTSADVIQGADTVCRIAAQREAVALVGLESRGGPTAAVAPSLQEVSSDLSQSLTRLSEQDPNGDVAALAAANELVVRASAAVAPPGHDGAGKSEFNRALDAYVAAGTEFATLAERRGFDATGCAARPGTS